MKKNNKTSFLILRVEDTFKVKVVKKAASLGQTVSDFIRSTITPKVK